MGTTWAGTSLLTTGPGSTTWLTSRGRVPPDDEYVTRPALTDSEIEALRFLSANSAMLSKSPVMHKLSAAGVQGAVMSLYAKLRVGNPADVLRRATALGVIEPLEDELPTEAVELQVVREPDPASRAFTTELFFLADSAEALHDVAAELRRAGFLVRDQPRDLDGTWSLTAYSAATLLDEQDRRVLYDIAERCGAEFDGTGTYVGPPEHDDGPGQDRPLDLMQLTPVEFERFVRRLFEARGLTSLTSKQAGSDDGIDLVMLHRDPILGGSTVVQAKKYSIVVGVSHIRELIGPDEEEKRAGHAVLVITSWFSNGCWAKAKRERPIELIDGPRLQGSGWKKVSALTSL